MLIKKIPDVTGVVKKTEYNTKISHIEKKYFITSDYNKLTKEILDAKIKKRSSFFLFNIFVISKKIII